MPYYTRISFLAHRFLLCRTLSPARGRKWLLRPAPRLHGNLPRPLDRHGRAHRAFARRITRIFVSRASAFARLHAAANAPESAVGRKRAAPARGRKRLLRPAPCLHGNLPRPLDCHGRAHRALARRIVLHANLRLLRVGFRPAARRRQCARIRRRKEARRASAQAKAAPTPPPRFHGNPPRPLDRHGRANRALARRITRIFVSRASAFARLHAAANAPESAVGRKRAGESGSYDPPRAFTVISRVHSTATVARTVPSLGASRESSSPAHRLSRGYAKCQRAGKNDFYDPHGNLPHPLDHHGRANRALARRIVLHANLRLPRVGFRPAARRRQCARICRRKETRRASARAKVASTTRPVPSREFPAST